MNLESRLLDGKPAGYCSSSDEEEDDFKVVNDEDEHQANVMRRMGPSCNTGAKGVLGDFQNFREQTRLAMEMKNAKFFEQAKRGMMMSTREERERMQKEDEMQDEELLDEIRQRRLAEIKKLTRNSVVEIINKNQFSEAVDGSTNYLLCVIIYEPDVEECSRISYICKLLAADHPKTKFLRATSSVLGMSDAFRKGGVPALQFYKNGNLIGNFVRISDLIGHDDSAEKLLAFLRKNRIDLTNGSYMTESDDEEDYE